MTVPFHRRILPWIFIIMFLAVAPALVFFTSGYRWNSKKGQVERNGTVILDSTPSGALIQMDGSPVQGKTPLTLQDVTPGVHRFTITKDGYVLWEKSLDVQAEHVTFANDVWLWKSAIPLMRDAGSATAITSSDDERVLVAFTNGTTTRAEIADTLRAVKISIDFSRALSAPIRTRWSSDNRHLLVESPDAPAYVLDALAKTPPVELPSAAYRWEGAELVGNASTSQIRIEFPSLKITRDVLPRGTADIFAGTELRHATGSDSLVYVPRPSDPRGYVLTPGSWLFWGRDRTHVIFNAADRWLSLQDVNGAQEYHEAVGDRLRLFPDSSGDRFLLIRGGELWLWDLKNDPEILYRQSDPILAAAWHHQGNDVFFATSKNVFALNLDQRDGRHLTTLASFDLLTDMIVFKNDLLLSGEKDGQKGVWTLSVE